MQEKQKGRCIYCGGEVLYDSGDSGRSLVRCDWCGQTLAVAGFENELTRMKAAIAEGEQAKKDLAAAKEAEQEARQRLNQVLTGFDELSASQKHEEETAEQIKAAFAEDAVVQSAMMDLLAAIRTEAADGRDVLGDLLGALTRGQQDAGLRLTALQNLSGEILKAQKDFGAQLSLQTEIYNRLQAAGADIKKSQELLQSLMAWFQTANDDECARLEQIASSSASILQNQKEAADQLSRLQTAADQTQKTIRDFESHYTRDRLEELCQLYHQAENFQLDRDYDKAADYYRQVITKGGQDAEVLWRLLLCHYCITYRKNDAGEPVPTILYPDLTDPEEMSVRRELASAMGGSENRRIYETELARIDGILDEYRLASQEAAYDFDVFLSVRQEKDGHFTKDSDVASDLYDFLTSRGLRVFNSRRVVLPVGKSYEPYIISALLSAKVMIVVGSSADNMNSQWVKDEWSRFQWLQKREKKQHGKTDRRLLCYLTGGMRPEQIPRSLGTGRQAVVDGVKAHEQLTELLEEMPVLGKRNAVKRQTPAEDSFEKVAGQMTVWLYNGKFDKVRERYQELNESGKHLEQVKLHLFALCAENQIDDISKLAKLKKDLSQERLFQLAQKLSSGEEKDELQRILRENQAYQAQMTKETEEKKRPEKTDPKKKPTKTAGKDEPIKGTVKPKTTDGPKKDPEEPGNTDDNKKRFPIYYILVPVLAICLVIGFALSRGGSGPKTAETEAPKEAVELSTETEAPAFVESQVETASADKATSSEKERTIIDNALTEIAGATTNQAAANVAISLINDIYVQTWTEDTEAQCIAARTVWDHLTEEQKKLVNKEYPDYFGTDTGDASLDDPRNADEIGEMELLVVSFGTSDNSSRVQDIGSIEEMLQAAYPDVDVRRAFTSQIIINHIFARDGEQIDNVEQALQRAVDNGVKKLMVLPTLLLPGAEYDELTATVEQYEHLFDSVAIASPLLADGDSLNDVAEAFITAAAHNLGAEKLDPDIALVLIGHGTSHTAKSIYNNMQKQIRELGYNNVFIGTLDGEPEGTGCEDIVAVVAEAGYQEVILRPLMITAGAHAMKQISGDQEDSWLSRFSHSGYFNTYNCQAGGIGTIFEIKEIFLGTAGVMLDEVK